MRWGTTVSSGRHRDGCGVFSEILAKGDGKGYYRIKGRMDKQAMENAIDRVKVLYMELSRTLNVPKKGCWIPRSIDEARLVLRESWSLCDALCELIRLAERESKAWSREVAQVVAYPIGYLFMGVDEVVYAWYPELVPDDLKEAGKEYRSSCRDKERGVQLHDLEAIKQKIKEMQDKLRRN